jgi:hypothetical protein
MAKPNLAQRALFGTVSLDLITLPLQGQSLLPAEQPASASLRLAGGARVSGCYVFGEALTHFVDSASTSGFCLGWVVEIAAIQV